VCLFSCLEVCSISITTKMRLVFKYYLKVGRGQLAPSPLKSNRTALYIRLLLLGGITTAISPIATDVTVLSVGLSHSCTLVSRWTELNAIWQGLVWSQVKGPDPRGNGRFGGLDWRSEPQTKPLQIAEFLLQTIRTQQSPIHRYPRRPHTTFPSPK